LFLFDGSNSCNIHYEEDDFNPLKEELCSIYESSDLNLAIDINVDSTSFILSDELIFKWVSSGNPKLKIKMGNSYKHFNKKF